MTFKIGDKVRRTGASFMDATKGGVYVVAESPNGSRHMRLKHLVGRYDVREFELVGEVKTPRPHAELIKAWADGAVIQGCSRWAPVWQDVSYPAWSVECEYRIKPEVKPDIVMWGVENNPVTMKAAGYENMSCVLTPMRTSKDQAKLTFDGETGKLKAVELINGN